MNAVTDDLADALSAVQRPGDFHVSGLIDVFPPRIEVDGVGPLALPLQPSQALALVAAAERAPYGRGAETIVDTAVRRTWQIGADRVQVGGKHWPRTLAEIVGRAAAGLGVDEPVEAELYKLLVYDEGSFFVGHRDTEKAPGMFATMVLALPSRSAGGELVVRHGGREARLDLRCEEPSEIAFAAFYADCVHEVLPVTSGHRATLVYNLLRKGGGPALQPPDYAGEAAEVAARLRRWADSALEGAEEQPVKLVYPLSHAYTPAELGFAGLKGTDAAVAGVLATAAPLAGCELHLALLTIEESGAAEYDGYRGRWEEPEMEAGEVFDRHETLSDWRRPDGEATALGPLPIGDEEISPPGALEDMEPDEEHFHEATGNEGASFDRTYRRAALVVWPARRTLAVINQAGLEATLPYLDGLATRWKDRGGDPGSPLRAQAVTLAGHMLSTWPADWDGPARSGSGEVARMLSLLTVLGDRSGVLRLLGTLVVQGWHRKSDNGAILEALDLFPADRAVGHLRRIVAAGTARSPRACSALLAMALRGRFESDPAALTDVLADLLAALPGDPARAPVNACGRVPRAAVDADCVAELVGTADAVDPVLAQRLAAYLLAWPKQFGLDGILVPAARGLARSGRRGGVAFEALRAASLEHLRRRASEPLAAPTDWSRDSAVGCRCGDCVALARFLEDPATRSWSLKAAEQARSHVESVARNAGSDVDMRTERRGRPYTLVCTKNQASYERRAKQRKADLADIALLAR